MNMNETRLDAINGTAGAGFRLSLVLNAVKAKMETADGEIQKISKGISDFSLMLKQVGRTMQEGGMTATPLAIETVFDIKGHSERVFDEIKSMTELAQIRNEDGRLTEIGIGRKVVWCFKKEKVPYLLGQLDYLKLNLSIMLQVLQLGKLLAPTHPQPSNKVVMQERAEIQNMIVLQHFSFEELRGLYNTANNEAAAQDSTSPTIEEPPPRYDAPVEGDVRLSISAPERPPKEPLDEEDGPSKAMVHYREQPLQQLDQSLQSALIRENSALSANVPDIVNYLVQQWVQPGPPQHPSQRALTYPRQAPKKSKYQSHYSSDSEEDTTESEYEDAECTSKGYYLEGPQRNGAGPRNVRFHPKVEDDIDEEEIRPKRSSRRHILQSYDEESSDSSTSGSPVAHRHHAHRDSTSSTSPPDSRKYQGRRDSASSVSRYELPAHPPSDRSRRPYGSAGPSREPSDPSNAGRPGQPRNPQHASTMPPRPMPTPNQNPHMQTQSSTGGLRPPQFNGVPQYNGPPPPLPRMPSGSQYLPQGYMTQSPGGNFQSPGTSPMLPQGAYFPRQPGFSGPPPNLPPTRNPPRSRIRRSDGRPTEKDKAKEKRESASHNLKKGIGIGAAAAGLLELLSGLDGI